MTTSLAALASTPSAHSSNTVLMSPNTITNSTQIIDSAEYDSNLEIKNEFYTREGLWKHVKHGEFVRQQQNSNYTQSQMSGQTNGSNQIANQNQTSNSNEPVKIAYFKYSNDLLLQQQPNQNNNSQRLKMQHKNYCIKCMKLIISNQQKRSEPTNRAHDYDDDDDIVYFNETSPNTTIQDESALCKYCNSKLNSNDSISTNTTTSNNNNNTANCLDVVVFNFAREIYFYEFNIFNKTKPPNDLKNLIDKKVYRSFISTCFDVNLMASNCNTLDLQNKSVLKTDSTETNVSNGNTTTTTINKLNLSTNCLSLILAAGFNKGEIHVFDGFKKEASVFYNNNKLVDKTKVTCIKWIPNSMNLFLAGHSSGNIYLYDANNQTQPNTAPIFTKLYQDESFSVHINNHATLFNSTTNTTPSNPTKNAKQNGNAISTSNNNSASSFNSMNNNDNNSTQSRKSQDKLILLSTNQQPVQVAKNPLLKWTIGASNSIDTATNTNEQVFFNTSSNCVGVNGVNEFAFSPCGAYLAIVSQDGYMRVFSFSYQNNQQMNIQLHCSMKSYFGGLLCVTWSSDGKYIATGGEDDLITIFSFIDMRVACRGRGHSSWINCCSFDPWTCLNSNTNDFIFTKPSKSTNLKQNGSKYDDNDESDLEEFHSTGIKNLNLNQTTSVSFAEQKKITATKKNRTISTLSDINYSATSSTDSIYYRLASCGQDNQVCFWDLSEECLKEKSLPHSRSRMTSLVNTQSKAAVCQQLPQIIIQPSELISESNKMVQQTIQQHQHHTSSSIVSTARSLFSLKHNNLDSNKALKFKNKLNDLAESDTAYATTNTSHKNGSFMNSTFFKKHKRNASLTNTGITNGLQETAPNQINSNKNKSKSNQVTLKSYKNSNTANLADTIQAVDVKQTKHIGFNESPNKQMIQNSNNTAMFNLCPKLDEIPMIEPLVCKRIANERLTSIVFKEDCFMVSTQDGYVFTWSRPVSASSNKNQSNPLPQLSSEFRTNTTSL